MEQMFDAASPPRVWSVFDGLDEVVADGPGGERVDNLLAGADWWLERIVSRGDATPAGAWYDQETDEWVLVAKGAASLDVEVDGELSRWDLGPGDSCFLPARCRHRVVWTALDEPTVWLAVHRRPPVR